MDVENSIDKWELVSCVRFHNKNLTKLRVLLTSTPRAMVKDIKIIFFY